MKFQKVILYKYNIHTPTLNWRKANSQTYTEELPRE